MRKTTKSFVAELAGWYGMCAIIGAYGLVSFDVISSDDYLFQLLNLTGSLGILTISLVKRVKQSIVLNVFWAGIAIVALAGMLL